MTGLHPVVVGANPAAPTISVLCNMNEIPPEKPSLRKVYRHIAPNKLERVRISQLKPGDQIRVIDDSEVTPMDGNVVSKVVGKPMFSVRTGLWNVSCDDLAAHKPLPKRVFEEADRNLESGSNG